MSSVLDEVLEANRRYSASFGEKGKLALPPARRFAILTCMDARMDPAKFAGLAEGDAHVIRNAGGRASDDAVRSLVISYKLLGTREFFVIHHTNCGMEFFTNEVIRGLLDNSLETADLTPSGFRDVGKGPGSRAGEFIEWLTIADPMQAVIDDVNRLRNHPLIPRSIPIYGYVFNVTTGELVEVEGAKKAGAASKAMNRPPPFGGCSTHTSAGRMLFSMDQHRRMGLPGTIALVMGQSIALGIFLTPAAMAKSLGAPLLLAAVWCGMGLITLCGALCYSELAVRYPLAGGEYVYLREGYGEPGRVSLRLDVCRCAGPGPGSRTGGRRGPVCARSDRRFSPSCLLDSCHHSRLAGGSQ